MEDKEEIQVRQLKDFDKIEDEILKNFLQYELSYIEMFGLLENLKLRIHKGNLIVIHKITKITKKWKINIKFVENAEIETKA